MKVVGLEHQCTITVRSYELDSYNHVNNAVYLNYLEFARMELLKSIKFDLNSLHRKGYAMIVAKINIAYKKPAGLNDTLLIKTIPHKLGKTSGVFKQIITRGSTPICEAEVTWVLVDDKGRPSRIPAELELGKIYSVEI
ncbi:MAG: thioesterase family protein [Spirochaetota bacterium]